MTAAIRHAPVSEKRRASVPQPGTTVATSTEERASHFRAAATQIGRALRCTDKPVWFSAMFGAGAEQFASAPAHEPVAERAAWALIAVRVLGRLAGVLAPDASFAQSLAWFAHADARDFSALAAQLDRDELDAIRQIESVRHDDDLRELLPYILDPHGPGSRLSVMRDPTTKKSRLAKRQNGVFYTPADVAEYMALETLKNHGGAPTQLRCIDPACGTGVFLRAMLRLVDASQASNRLDYALGFLFGVDVSLLAVEAACFVLLHDCLENVTSRGLTPASAWRALRLNFAAMDVLHVGSPSGQAAEVASENRQHIRATLLSSRCALRTLADLAASAASNSAPTSTFTHGIIPLDHLFPEASAGFDLLLANPPYAKIGLRENWGNLSRQFDCLGPNASCRSDIYPLFLELTWRFTRADSSAAAVVVPLSIAYHRGRQFAACRHAMLNHGGYWRFAFFDREPHALFGEDVKTRNAIAFRFQDPLGSVRQRARVATGALQKWTSRTRDRLFTGITFTELEGDCIANGIPKLSGPLQAHVAGVLSRREHRLADAWTRLSTCLPARAFDRSDTPRVFLGSTAYNFLNVFRPHMFRRKDRVALSTNPLTVLTFESEPLAWRAFAILSSRLVFWWWHVHCDGFHVPRWFIQDIPFNDRSFSAVQKRRLSSLAMALWTSLQDHIVVSLNGGRQSVAYRPLACDVERDAIDSILLDAAGVEPSFAEELRRFVRLNAVVDEHDVRRTAIRSHFQKERGTA